MSIMEKLFGTRPAAVPQPANPVMAPVQPGNIPATNAAPAHADNPTVPADSVKSDTPNPLAGLDQFKDMWAPVDPANAPKPPEAMFAGVTQEGLQTAAKKNDFSKVVTPEMMQAIAGGGDQAVAATLQAMQAMSQKSFADSAFATTKIVEQALAKQQTQFEAMIPGLVKNQTVSDNLRNANPIFNHPAAAPILDMFKNQVLQKYPNATAAEQQEMAMKYITNFAEAATPPKPQSAAQKAAGAEMDWSIFGQYFN